ncbi:MAG: glycosyltransferase family 9 protein [Pirellulales bacterium]
MSTHCPRILIVRLSAIGDCLHGLPVLCALRDALPSAHLSWVVEGRTADLLRRHPALDAVVQVPRKWLKSPRAVWRARRQLRGLRPDVAIDLQGLTKSAIAAWLSGAPTRIGFSGRDGREVSTWLNNSLVEPMMTHVIDRNLELLRPLDVARDEVRFGLPSFDNDDTAIDRFLRDRGLSAGFALLNVGAGWPSKRWPADRFAEVARYLGERYHLRSVIAWAGDEERRWADQIVVAAGGFAHMGPQTTLTELAALCHRAKFFVGCDTGPLHLAVAMGTPCIGLYGPTSARRNGPYGDRQIALQRARLADNTRKSLRIGDNASMLVISVEDVCSACDAMMERFHADQAPRRCFERLAA